MQKQKTVVVLVLGVILVIVLGVVLFVYFGRPPPLREGETLLDSSVRPPPSYNCGGPRWNQYMEHLYTENFVMWKQVSEYVLNHPPHQSHALLTQMCNFLESNTPFGAIDTDIPAMIAVANSILAPTHAAVVDPSSTTAGPAPTPAPAPAAAPAPTPAPASAPKTDCDQQAIDYLFTNKIDTTWYSEYIQPLSDASKNVLCSALAMKDSTAIHKAFATLVPDKFEESRALSQEILDFIAETPDKTFQGCDRVKLEAYLQKNPDDVKDLDVLYQNSVNSDFDYNITKKLTTKLDSLCKRSNPDGRISANTSTSFQGWMLSVPKLTDTFTSQTSCPISLIQNFIDSSSQRTQIYEYLNKVRDVRDQAEILQWMCNALSFSDYTVVDYGVSQLLKQAPPSKENPLDLTKISFQDPNNTTPEDEFAAAVGADNLVVYDDVSEHMFETSYGDEAQQEKVGKTQPPPKKAPRKKGNAPKTTSREIKRKNTN